MPATPRTPMRRRVIAGISSLALLAALPKALLAALLPTPRQSLGPFYPNKLPLDNDNDLVQVAGREDPAKGEITDLTGRVIDQDGQPVPGALVEIWQCDANGRYLHSRDTRTIPRDPNFQGYGRYTTGADGRYRFRTIRPVPYPGRAPHIHFAVSTPGREPLVTQMYVRGAPENSRDWLLNGVSDPAARESLIVAFEPAPGNPLAQLRAEFEIVLASAGDLAHQGR